MQALQKPKQEHPWLSQRAKALRGHNTHNSNSLAAGAFPRAFKHSMRRSPLLHAHAASLPQASTYNLSDVHMKHT